MARSFLLSIERYEDGSDREHYCRELSEIGERIQRGEQIQYDEMAVRREIRIIRLGQQATWRDALKMFFGSMLWLWPLWLLTFLGLYFAFFT